MRTPPNLRGGSRQGRTRWSALTAVVRRRRSVGRDDLDRGAVLILALIFVVAVGLVTTALATWATNDLNNSKTFTTVEALHSDATGMMKMSVQYVRYNPIISSSQASNVASPVVACWGGTDPTKVPVIDNLQVAVWCSTLWNPGSATTRTVTFYACPAAVPASVCTTPGKTLLTEVVVFDDYPSGVNAPIQALCTISCGSGITITSSTWGPSTVDSQVINASSISFSQEPSPTSVGVATTAYVQILGGSSLPISNQQVTISVSSGGSLSSSSTLTSSTNTSGIAVFNNIVPSSAGSIILQAVDGSLSTTSTAFQVAQGANAVTLSAAPTNPQVGSQVNVTATATSGDVIVTSGSPGITVTSSTTAVCTASGGTINLVGVGQCSLIFSDSGNANYVAASASMTFTVAPVPVTAIAATVSSPTVGASALTNDQLTLTLQGANGVNTVSSGTTTVALSQSGNGYFASANGMSSNITSVTFANGVGTVKVYFGDKTAESVTVTASSGTLTPGTVGVSIVPGTANSIGVTATTPVTASATTNDAVTLSLQDQYGNTVSPTSSITLALSSTGSGYFAATSASAGPLASVTLPAGGSGTAIVYFGDQTAETASLSAAGSGYSGSTFVAVSAASPSKVVMTAGTSTYASSSSNLPISVQLEDQYGNVVTPSAFKQLTLSSTGSGYFTSTNGGSSHITSTSIAANTSSTTVYFGDAVAQSPTITVSGAGLSSATATISVTNAPPSALTVVAATSSFTATNQGTDQTTLTLVDSSGNPVNAPANLTLNLSNSGQGFFTTLGAPTVKITTIQLASGKSSVAVLFGDATAESVTLSVTTSYAGNTYSGSSSSLAINAGTYAKIVLTPNPLSAINGYYTNALIDVQAEDQYGNATALNVPTTTFYITDTGGGCYSNSSGQKDGSKGNYCNGGSNYSHVWPVNLTGGQATVFFGDNRSGDKPTITLYKSSTLTSANAVTSIPATVN